jgi:diphthamide synthase subunit DPH2
MVCKKATHLNEAKRIRDFLESKGIEAEIERNEGFLADKYRFHVVGGDEEGIGVIERHEPIVNVMTGEKKRKATWNKPRDRWGDRPKRIRT